MNLFRLIVLLFLSFFSFNSFSYVLNIDPGTPLYPHIYESCKGPNYNYGNLESSLLPSGNFWVSFKSGLWSVNTNCMQAFGLSCPIGTDSVIFDSRYNRAVCTTKNICPANSTKKDGYCTCNSGYEENGNSCVPEPPDTCKEIESTCSSFKNERIPRFDVYYSGSTPGGACSNPPLDGCSKGCYLQFTGISVYYKDNEGRSIASGPASFTGDSCVHSEQVTDPDPEKICKKGEFPDVVNGKKVCIPAIEKETDHQPKTENKPDGSTSETKSTVSCTDGKCTVTETTTTKDSTGAVTGVSGTSTVYSEADFCQKNPASGVCSGTGTGTGTGTGEGEGEGEGTGTGEGEGEGEGEGTGPGSTGTASHPEWKMPTIYESKYPDGFSSAYENSGLKEASGIFDGLVNAFIPKFADSGGACQNFNISLDIGVVNFGTFNISPPCILWPFLWLMVQITAVFTFRALVFGG